MQGLRDRVPAQCGHLHGIQLDHVETAGGLASNTCGGHARLRERGQLLIQVPGQRGRTGLPQRRAEFVPRARRQRQHAGVLALGGDVELAVGTARGSLGQHLAGRKLAQWLPGHAALLQWRVAR